MTIEISKEPEDRRYVGEYRLARQLSNDKKDKNLKNVIVALGDSFTDPTFKVDLSWIKSEGPPPLHICNWKMWPEVFKDLLEERDNHEYHVVNLGRQGSGIDYAFECFTKVWPYLKNRIKFVLWGGTDFNRFEHHSIPYSVSPDTRRDDFFDVVAPGHGEEFYRQYDELGVTQYMDAINRKLHEEHAVKRIMTKKLRLITFVEDLCTSNSTEFLYYPLIEPFGGGSFYKTGGRSSPTLKTTQKYLQDIPFTLNIKNNKKRLKHYVNLYMKFSGVFWTSWSSKVIIEGQKLRICDDKEWKNTDGHPDKHGQIDIANQVWNHYITHD